MKQTQAVVFGTRKWCISKFGFGFCFNTLVAATTLLVHIFVGVYFWQRIYESRLGVFPFWFGLVFIIYPYGQYANAYSRLDEYAQIEGASTPQLSRDILEFAGHELDMLMSCYWAAVGCLLFCFLRAQEII